MNGILHQNLQALAVIRRDLEDCRQAYKARLLEFESRPEIAELAAKIKGLEDIQETLDALIRRDAETLLMQTGETGHPAVKTRLTTSVVIDEVQALAWAKINMPIAVIQTVDKKMLTDYAKKHEPEWAGIEKKQQILIARDLSACLDPDKINPSL